MNRYDELFSILSGLECAVIKNPSLSNYTTFRIGGPASLLVTPDNAEKARVVLQLIRQMELPFLIVGNGSNILVSDTGFEGVAISTGGLDYCKVDNDGVIDCGAGLRLASLCRVALEHELSGLEFAYGIPGSIGGAVYMNAGAYGGEMKDVLLECRHITTKSEEGVYIKNNADFAYRKSFYTNRGHCITSAKFRLKKGSRLEIENRMVEIMKKRCNNQPLDMPSAGSVFKRPHNSYAGMLIEECGLKGYAIGGAMVSLKHAGFIVNTGKATASDVKKLIEFIQDTVYKKNKVLLETEIVFV